ncbi:MAG TPA: DUF779 domain-containing protein [Acidimicrobiales bacterium]
MSAGTDDHVVEPAVTATPVALAAIAERVGERGPILFFQSGGCCDGSLPICFEDGEFVIGDHDVLLGRVGGCPFYIDHRQYAVWKHTQLILGVGEGEPEGFSIPAGAGRHFVISSRVLEPVRPASDHAPPEATAPAGPTTRRPR